MEREMFKYAQAVISTESVCRIESKAGVPAYLKERVYQFSSYKKRMSNLIRCDHLQQLKS